MIGLVLATLSLQPGLVAMASGATPSSTGSTAFISFGFGPSSMAPASNGIPVFTVGDTIWAESGYNYSIPLSVTSARANASSPTRVVAVKLLESQVITPLYTFTSVDADGIWNVTIGGLRGAIVIPVHFVNPAAHPVSLSPLAYSLSGGNMSISTQANLGDSYDQQVCTGGNATSYGITLTLPSGLHDQGKLLLAPGNPINVTTIGVVNQTFSFWFQLFHPYSLDSPGANSLVVSNLLTAESKPVTFASTGSTNTTLALNAPLREGRYDFRAYFQDSTSLDVVQSRLLVVNDSSWISLSTSCQPQLVQSQNVSYSASLTRGQLNWPRSLFVMYRNFGVESVASFPVRANLSSVDFVASPWNAPLQGVKVNVSPGPGIAQTSQAGSTLFVLASHYPLELNYSVDINGGHDVAQGTVRLDGSYSALSTDLKLAKLTLHVLSDQTSPTTLSVTGPQGVSITTGLLGSNQTSSFILPGGSYTVKASQGGDSQSAQVALTNGLATAVTLNFSTFLSFEIILIVTAIMAALANVVVWVLRSRSLGSRLAAK